MDLIYLARRSDPGWHCGRRNTIAAIGFAIAPMWGLSWNN